ncbi:MAG: hypothetical protein LBI48_06805 [Burkholderiaceae bacterium]|jgi:type II secretory pathway component PulF|nr:hypothetical protein [Burkholderiaceae bacterium]
MHDRPFHAASRFAPVIVTMLALTMRNAFACGSEDDSLFVLSVYAGHFVTVMVAAAILTAIVWGIKLAFFRQAASFPVSALMSIIFGIVIGLVGTFMAPAFDQVFESFGAYLPMPTKLVINFRYLLWTPLFLIAVSWRSLRLNPARRRYYVAALLSEMILLAMILAALYMPIFKLGSACG